MLDKKAFSKIVAGIAVVVVIIIAVVAVAYFFTQPSVPTPTSTQTPGITQTSPPTPTTPPAQTPTQAQPVVNFRVGAYTEYLVKTQGEEGMTELTYRMSIDGEELYNGRDCWILTLTYVQGNAKMLVYMWINKIKYEFVHILVRMYENGVLVMERELDPKDASQNLPHPVDLQYVKAHETVTVIGGTFVNCLRVEAEQEGIISKVWVHESVPIFGVVKAEIFENNVLTQSMELTSYGG